MPWPLLLALVLAFGFDGLAGPGPVSESEFATRLVSFAGGCVGLVALAWLTTWRLTSSKPRRRRLDGVWRLRGLSRLASSPVSAFEWANVAIFAWGLLALEWPRLVAWNLGLRSTILLDELLVFAPFLVTQLGIWAATYRLEAPAHSVFAARSGRVRHVWTRARQSIGMALPLLVIYGLGRDMLRVFAPQWEQNPVVQIAGLGLLALLILVLAPLFIRIAMPTHRLEAGPLRDRLEALGRRFHFRTSDILVWETNGTIVNAGVTGALPWFRYVLLTDALIERLEPEEIEAVYGHEVGHVVHRHLALFGYFFLVSAAIVTLIDTFVQSSMGSMGWTPPAWLNTRPGEVVQWLVALACLGGYFVVAFGFLSRKFERQADVFGCRVVSCVDRECPPHQASGDESTVAPVTVCPGGIDVFARALTTVALLNGLRFEAPSWRHGSIAERVAFLRHAAAHPADLRRFETSVRRLQWFLAVALAVTGIAIAVALSGMIRWDAVLSSF